MEIKLRETLRDLIEQRGFRRNRKPILLAANISPGALSQYLSGKNNPSLPVLVDLANFFNVSLDYLVLGVERRESETPDYGPLARYVDLSLARVQDQANRHSALVARVGRALADRVNSIASELTELGAAAIPAGMMYDDETLAVEGFSIETRLISMNLSYDILVDPESGEDAAGRFLPIVAANLDKGRSYKFLLPSPFNSDWETTVNRFRSLLSRQVASEAALGNCQFRITEGPTFVGIGIYRLDSVSLKEQDPLLYQQLADFISEEGWLGYSIPPSPDMLADSAFDANHLENAIKSFDSLWRKAKPI